MGALDSGAVQRQARGRLAAMRWVLANLDYPGKDEDVVGSRTRSSWARRRSSTESGEGSGIRYEKGGAEAELERDL